MDKVRITVDLPKSFCAAMGVREADLTPMIREILAVEFYRAGRLSLGKAAEVVGITRYEMIQRLAKYDVWLAYDVQDAADDWTALKEVLP